MRLHMIPGLPMRCAGLRGGLVLFAVLSAVVLLGQGGWIHAKGWLGQQLMARAWSSSIEHARDPRSPWPGARTRPVARLVVPELAIDRLVLDGIEVPGLAWGPGLVRGANGHRVIAGHRDTHFRFLGDLEPGQKLTLQPAGGPSIIWEIDDRRIVDSRIAAIDLDAPGPLLTLLTCYPLDGIEPGTPFRLVLRARPVDEPLRSSDEALAWEP